jgi:hypothetical protein
MKVDNDVSVGGFQQNRHFLRNFPLFFAFSSMELLYPIVIALVAFAAFYLFSGNTPQPPSTHKQTEQPTFQSTATAQPPRKSKYEFSLPKKKQEKQNISLLKRFPNTIKKTIVGLS